MSNITLGIDDVQVIDKLYPRLRPIEMKIQEYQDNVEAAPRIIVARGCVLVDGYHRWQAHKRNGATTVEAIDLGDMTDEEILVESSRLNSRHGTSLTMDEKRRLALVLAKPYGSLTQGDTAKVLSVSLRTVKTWLAKADAEARAARKAEEEAKRKRDIAEAERLRAEGKTQREIADTLGVSQSTVRDWLSGEGNSAPSTQSTAPGPEVDAGDDDREQSTTVDADPAEATTPTPAAEPEPQPEPLDDETRQYLEQWSEDGDLVAEVESGRMTVAEATKHAKTAQRLYEHSEKHSPFKAHGEANQALKAACDLMTNFLSVSAVALDADDPQLWRRLRILAPQTIERLTQWKEAADVKVD